MANLASTSQQQPKPPLQTPPSTHLPHHTAISTPPVEPLSSNHVGNTHGTTRSQASWADKVRISHAENRFSLKRVFHELSGEIPKVRISKQLQANSTTKWERCLIGYFAGTTMPYHAVRDIAIRAWRGYDFEASKASEGFFLFRFKHEEGIKQVKENGPWLFGGKAIILQQWYPSISFDVTRVKRIPVWVNL